MRFLDFFLFLIENVYSMVAVFSYIAHKIVYLRTGVRTPNHIKQALISSINNSIQFKPSILRCVCFHIILSHLVLVQPVQLFESTKFRDYWSTLTCHISWLVHAINSQQCYRTFFSKSVFKLDISGFKLGQKTQNLTEKFFFAKRMWVL